MEHLVINAVRKQQILRLSGAQATVLGSVGCFAEYVLETAMAKTRVRPSKTQIGAAHLVWTNVIVQFVAKGEERVPLVSFIGWLNLRHVTHVQLSVVITRVSK